MYVLQRPGYHGDSDISFKVKLIYFPIVGILVCCLWALASSFLRLLIVVPLLVFLIMRFAIDAKCGMRQSNKKSPKHFSMKLSLPSLPRIYHGRCKYTSVTKMLINLSGANVLPAIIICVTTQPQSAGNWVVFLVGFSLGSFLACLVLHWLGNHSNPYKVTKRCCTKPFVHRSMVIDWLKKKKYLDQTDK